MTQTSESIETLLEGLTGPLETTYTVDLSDVRANLQKWIPSMVTLHQQLLSSGAVREVKLTEAKKMARGRVDADTGKRPRRQTQPGKMVQRASTIGRPA